MNLNFVWLAASRKNLVDCWLFIKVQLNEGNSFLSDKQNNYVKNFLFYPISMHSKFDGSRLDILFIMNYLEFTDLI